MVFSVVMYGSYCVFSNTHELRGSKVNKLLCSTCMLFSIILLADLNRSLLQQVQKVMICGF